MDKNTEAFLLFLKYGVDINYKNGNTYLLDSAIFHKNTEIAKYSPCYEADLINLLNKKIINDKTLTDIQKQNSLNINDFYTINPVKH